MKRLLYSGIFSWVLGSMLATQVTALPAMASINQLAPADSVTKKNWWTIGLEAANNASFFGRNAAVKFPYAAASLTYAHHTGLYASAMTYQVFNSEDYIDETDVSVGYAFKIKKLVDANLSYSRFIFSKNSPLVKSVTNNAANAQVAYDWKYLYTGLTSSYIFGNSSDLFLVLDNSRYIALNPIWKSDWPIGIDPKISITAGTQQFSEVYEETKVEERTTYSNNKEKGNNSGTTIGGVTIPVIGNGGGNGNSGSTPTKTKTTTTTQREVTINRFRVLNYDLKIPVVFSLGNFEFEPTYRYSIPVNLMEGDESKAQSFYSISVGYTF